MAFFPRPSPPRLLRLRRGAPGAAPSGSAGRRAAAAIGPVAPVAAPGGEPPARSSGGSAGRDAGGAAPAVRRRCRTGAGRRPGRRADDRPLRTGASSGADRRPCRAMRCGRHLGDGLGEPWADASNRGSPSRRAGAAVDRAPPPSGCRRRTRSGRRSRPARGPPVATTRPSDSTWTTSGCSTSSSRRKWVMARTPRPHSVVASSHPPADGAQGVDVEARVDLVEHGEAGTQHAQLQRLVALALAAGQVDVERPVEEPLVEADRGPPRHAARPRRPSGGDRPRRGPPGGPRSATAPARPRAPRSGTAWPGTARPGPAARSAGPGGRRRRG